MERFRVRYEKHRPKVLYCYATVLAAFASHLQKHGFRHRPKILITTAEVLSDANRALIESVFGIPVHNYYGSRDIGMIGAECSGHSGTHFHPWGSYVEFDPIGDTPDGPAYRLLVTDLLNYGQPFIRYDTGDCVTLAKELCSCGRWFPRASKILGRVGDGIVLTDGSVVPAVSVGNHISQIGQNFRAIAKMQFIQKTHEHLHLRYVVKDDHPSAETELKTICNAIDSLANQRMRWTLEKVSDIPREQSGKVRLCISELTTSVSSRLLESRDMIKPQR
jgi:phenylacetate-CoA ligase